MGKREGNRTLIVAVFVAAVGLSVLSQLLVATSMKAFIDAYRPFLDMPTHAVRTIGLTLSPPVQSPSSTHPVPKRKWAYVYFVAGCHPDSPNYYIGMLYNVVIGARILHQFGSNTDVVLLLQMHVDTSAETLPPDQANMLSAAGVKVRYLEKPTRRPTFHETMMRKFELLRMIDYSRVLYMDADAIPLCSLDYLFELSEPDDETVAAPDYNGPILRSNLALAWRMEPASGGFFMVQPGPTYYEEMQGIITRQLDEAFFIDDEVKFNRTHGWGHVFRGGDDVWTSLGGQEHKPGHNNTTWKWHGVHSDQGLQYYWSKYHRRDVSIIIGDKIEHWVDRDGTAVLHHRDVGILSKYPCDQPAIATFARNYAPSNANPYRQFNHFTGGKKPWLKATNRTQHGDLSDMSSTTKFWWKTLIAASKDLNFAIMYNVLDGTRAPYGSFNNHIQLRKAVMARAQALNLTAPQSD